MDPGTMVIKSICFLILIAVKTPNDRDFFDFVGERFKPLYAVSG